MLHQHRYSPEFESGDVNESSDLTRACELDAIDLRAVSVFFHLPLTFAPFPIWFESTHRPNGNI